MVGFGGQIIPDRKESATLTAVERPAEGFGGQIIPDRKESATLSAVERPAGGFRA